MEAGSRLTRLIDQLITLFNTRSDDAPDGLFDRRTQFLLNNVPYEEMVGRAAMDPLVLMLTRGPAGYRFTTKAVLHAVPDAKIERGEVTMSDDAGVAVVRCQCRLSGHLRGTAEPTETAFGVVLALNGAGTVARASFTMDERRLTSIAAARRRP
jgi:hypothetical protein